MALSAFLRSGIPTLDAFHHTKDIFRTSRRSIWIHDLSELIEIGTFKKSNIHKRSVIYEGYFKEVAKMNPRTML